MRAFSKRCSASSPSSSPSVPSRRKSKVASVCEAPSAGDSSFRGQTPSPAKADAPEPLAKASKFLSFSSVVAKRLAQPFALKAERPRRPASMMRRSLKSLVKGGQCACGEREGRRRTQGCRAAVDFRNTLATAAFSASTERLFSLSSFAFRRFPSPCNKRPLADSAGPHRRMLVIRQS